MAVTLVQHASATGSFTSGTSGTAGATFGSNTTPGNCLVACVSQWCSGTLNPSAPTANTNGAADNWAQAVGDTFSQTYVFADPGTAGGQKIVNILPSWTGTASGSNSFLVLMDIFEVAGLVASGVVDQVTSGVNFSDTSGAWSSDATATTSAASEFWAGIGASSPAAAATPGSITGPASVWTNETALSGTFLQAGSAYHAYQVSGYKIASSTGTATYSGTDVPASGSGVNWGSCAATLKGLVPTVSRNLSLRQAVMRSAVW